MKKPPKYPQVGNRIKELRGSKSQAYFAKEIGVSLQGYLNYEYGNRVPPGPVLAKIAELCGVTTDWILTGQKGRPESDRIEHKIKKVDFGSFTVTLAYPKHKKHRSPAMISSIMRLLKDLEDMGVRDVENILESIEEKKLAAAYRREKKIKGG